MTENHKPTKLVDAYYTAEWVQDYISAKINQLEMWQLGKLSPLTGRLPPFESMKPLFTEIKKAYGLEGTAALRFCFATPIVSGIEAKRLLPRGHVTGVYELIINEHVAVAHLHVRGRRNPTEKEIENAQAHLIQETWKFYTSHRETYLKK